MPQKPSPKSFALSANGNIIEFPRIRLSAPAAAEHLTTMGNVNRNEITSIKALTGYVAHNNNLPEDVVRACLQDEFKITDIADLRRDDYERAIKFLVDLRIDLLLN